MIIKCRDLVLLVLLTLNISIILADDCGTPAQCYIKAKSILYQDRKEMRNTLDQDRKEMRNTIDKLTSLVEEYKKKYNRVDKK